MELINNGTYVLLYLDEKRKFLVKVESGKVFHTHKGYIKLEELIGKPYGVKVKSNMNTSFIALKPTLKDYLIRIARKTQILYPKDMALILLYTNTSSGSRVVEGGTGSGALASLLAFYVKPNGKVYSYDVNKEFLRIAERNLEKLGLIDYVILKNLDLTEGIEEVDVDAVILDMPTPWLVVPHAYKALKNTGVFASFSPTIEQVIKTVEAMKKEGFTSIETVECMVREYQVETGRTRPKTLTVAHTGYLTFGRKMLSEDDRSG
ncbi:MAG: tRNA (adenine-N1)-methyltransferase [Candidatus Bathyarchaeota archaeon]